MRSSIQITEPMINDFLRYSEENNLFSPGDRILLAVSGGIDSMVMAHIFSRTVKSIAIAHCNFCLRGVESDLDEELVREFSAGNNISFRSKRFSTMEYASEKHISVQMAARDLRYAWFEEIRKTEGFDTVAVAHNLNDNIETMLINLTRGTGLTGLTGMRPLAGRIIRPLLFATREMIEKYAETHSVAFREDKSNAETKYLRNRIRHKIIPLLIEINPSAETTLNETSLRLAGADEIVTAFTESLRKRIITKKKGYLSADITALHKWLHNHTLIFELFRPYGITGSQVMDLISVIRGDTGSKVITGDYRIIRNREELIITGKGKEEEIPVKVSEISGFTRAGRIESAHISDISDAFKIPDDPLTGCFDGDKVTYPVEIRSWRPGDFFYPLGMDHRKKISDYLTDTRCPLPERENALVMESEGKIIWLVGKRIDNRFRITCSTRKALVIKSKPWDYLVP